MGGENKRKIKTKEKLRHTSFINNCEASSNQDWYNYKKLMKIAAWN